MPAAYPQAFEAFVAPARQRPELWRLGLGCVLAIAVYFAGIAVIFGAAYLIAGPEKSATLMASLAKAETPAATLILFLTFAGMALGPILAARVMHKRGAGTLFGRTPVVLRHFVLAVAVAGAIYGVTVGGWFVMFDATPGLDLSVWLAFLPLTLAGLLLQTGAEELVFRGYLQQQLAARFRSPVMWMILPAVIFGLVHYDPLTAGDNLWLIIASVTLFALVAADLTVVTGSLGAAWGFHFVNNFFAVGFIAVEGTLPGLALFVTPYAADDTGILRLLILADLATMAIAWAVLRRILRR